MDVQSKPRPKPSDRALLKDIFDFFQVPIKIKTGTSTEHNQLPIEAAGRRFIFNNKGAIVRIVENGKIIDVIPEDD